ncbi:uncharacterized protein LOC134911273 [Pseudophryne corroboree]|uniref:uncharacterized protein LOC134911273 n=1 Tax=Pseudophryne corroboree TaxID=495146 RepID=UPI00308143C3
MKTLIQQHPVAPVLYTLPKIHKHPTAPPGRPIIAARESIYYKISQYLDVFLQPVVQSQKTYLKDTISLIIHLQSLPVLPSNAFLCTLDIVSLYTNIPHSGGLSAVTTLLSSSPLYTGSELSFFIKLLELTLKRNYFLFDSRWFVQQQGCAMGSCVAPAFANSYMFEVERQALFNEKEVAEKIPFFVRYIDDLFLIWLGTETEFQDLMTRVNSMDSTIKFTYCMSTQCVNYLDVQISLQEGNIHTSLFKKSTDRNTILHGSSQHPASTKKRLPFSQFLRIHCISDDINNTTKEIDIMMRQFLTRGYKLDDMMEANRKVMAIPRSETLISTKNSRKASKGDTIPFVQQYNSASPMISKVVKNLWPVVTSDPDLKMLNKTRLLPSYTRNRNLKDWLVKNDVSATSVGRPTTFLSRKPGCYRCTGCTTCSFMEYGDSFAHPHSGERIAIRHILTCSSTYVVYIIRCPCGLLYVGKTMRQFKEHMALHRSSIRQALEGGKSGTNQPVARHFQALNHGLATLRYKIIDTVPKRLRGGDRGKALLQKEAQWIHRFNTITTKGLNEHLPLNCFL